MASKKVSPTLLVLREIRDAVRETNERVDVLSQGVDALGGRVDALGGRVDAMSQRIDETNKRLDALYELHEESAAGLITAIGELRHAPSTASSRSRSA